MVNFWVGMSGFSYPKWKGKFYPEDTKADKLLEAYAAKLNSVEINSSFYNTPTEKTVLKWAETVSDNFRFSFKANRRITHIKKLKNADAELGYMLKSLQHMGQKIGCLLVQLPPYMKADLDILDEFLKSPQHKTKTALEFRNESWLNDETYTLLKKNNTALCFADTEDMRPVLENTADFLYTRLRREKYSEQELKDWAKRLSEFSRGATDCFVYFMHDETGDAASTAVRFMRMLES